MYNSVNSINFKAIVLIEQSKFSDSQMAVVRDIQAKLGEKTKKNDYIIKPLENDIVELSQIGSFKKKGDGTVQYSDPLYIGKYDKNHPFEIKDIKNTYKQLAKFILQNLSILYSLLPIALGLVFVTSYKKEPIKAQTEKVVTVAKDSLQTIKQDSLNFVKENLRVLK